MSIHVSFHLNGLSNKPLNSDIEEGYYTIQKSRRKTHFLETRQAISCRLSETFTASIFQTTSRTLLLAWGSKMFFQSSRDL